jgi:hypothetical protein
MVSQNGLSAEAVQARLIRTMVIITASLVLSIMIGLGASALGLPVTAAAGIGLTVPGIASTFMLAVVRVANTSSDRPRPGLRHQPSQKGRRSGTDRDKRNG